jgi:hypothetical protein
MRKSCSKNRLNTFRVLLAQFNTESIRTWPFLLSKQQLNALENVLFLKILLRDLGTEVVRLSLECLIGLNNRLFQTQSQQTEYGQCLRNQFRVRVLKSVLGDELAY